MRYMNNMIGRYIATMLLALVSLTGWSATVTIDDALTHGIITTSTSGSKVTLTAKPEVGYFLNFDDLSVKAFTDAGGADGRQRAPIPMYSIEVTNNGDGTYSFTMPTEGYDVYVTAAFSQVTVTLPAGPYTYNGTAQTPTPTVKIGSTPLNASTEFSVGYSANTNAGDNTAVVTVSGAGKYFGTATASFTIGKAALTVKANDHSIGHGDEAGNNGVTYTGFVNGEAASVLDGTLTYAYKTASDGSGTSYTTASPVGTYYIIPGGLTSNNYAITFEAGMLTVSAEGAAGLSLSLDASIPAEYFVYDGTAKEPAVVVKDGEQTLTKDQDYTVSYSNNVNAGDNTAVATVTGIGNYSGEKKLNFTINKAPLTVKANDHSIGHGDEAGNNGVTYTGFVNGEAASVLDGTLTYTYKTASDGSGSTYTTASPVGTYYIIPGGLTSTNYAITFEAGTLTVSAEGAAGLSLSLDAAIPAEYFVYSGTAKEPAVVVKDGEQTLTKDQDYTVSYSNNVNAGDNTAVATVTGIGNYSGEKKLNFTINKAPLTITADAKSKTYGEADPALTYTQSGLVGTDAITGSLIRNAGVDVGDYAITQGTLTAGDNYAITFIGANLTIQQKEVGLSWGMTTFTYNGNPQAPTATATGMVNGDAIGVTVTVAGDHTDVGNYIATASALTGAKAGNYKLPAENTKAFSIISSDYASAVITANNRAYDGTTQDLVTIGTITNGATGTSSDVVFYADGTTTTPLPGVPQGTNAGSYDVYYVVTPDVNHEAPARAHLTVTITPITAIVTITGHNNTAVYDGNEHSVSGYDVTISNPLYQESDFTFSGTALAKRTEAGQTHMGLTKEQFTNTSTNFSSVTFNVTDGYQEITSPDDVIVMITGHSNTADYDGAEHSVSGYDVKISNPLYTVNDFTFSGTATAARTDAGTTNMGLAVEQFTNTNTNFSSVTFSVTDGYQAISPIAAIVTITGHNSTVTYDGAEHSVSGYEASFSNTLYKESDISFSGTATAARTEEGTTNMGLAVEQFTNTSANFNPVTFTVIDGYQTITPVTDVVVTIIGHKDTRDYDGAEHSVSSYDVKISNPLYKETDFTFSGSASATRTDAGTTNMGLAASQFTNQNGGFTNVTFKVTDGYLTINPINATVTIKGHSNMAVYDGTEHKVTGYDVSFSNNLYKESDFTFTGTASATRTDAGTTNMGLAVEQFTNTSANFSKVVFNVIDGYQTINKKVVKLTVTVTPKTYDGNANAEVSVDAETGVKDESMTISGLKGMFDNANAGTDKAVTVNSSEAVVTTGANTKLGNYEINYPTGANGTVTKRPVVVSGITAQDKDYDGTTKATLILSNAVFTGLIEGDNLTVTATGTFENAEAGDNKTVNITDLTLGGTSIANYVLAATGNQTTTTASIHAVTTIDRKHSGIIVRRNDTNAIVDNEAFLTVMTDGTLRIDHVNIVKPADATAASPVSVSIWIPATLMDYDGVTSGSIWGLANDIIVTDATVPVTDVYLPTTEKMINITDHAFRLDPTESTTARIHTTQELLDDYALCSGLAKEYADRHVMTTIKPKNFYWTLGLGCDYFVPKEVLAYKCVENSKDDVRLELLAAELLVGDEGVILANNGIIFECPALGGSYDVIARPGRLATGTKITTDDAHSYGSDNLLEPVIETKHFDVDYCLVLKNDGFHPILPNTSKVPATRAVLRRTSGMAKARIIGIKGGHHDDTGIVSVSCELSTLESSWYTLDGRKIDRPTKAGMYILNGKKVIVK